MMQHHVPIAGYVVRHTCDNPSCVNVEHLTVGTQRDNVRDMFDRGRAADRGRPYKVTDELVEKVLSDPGSSRQTAKRVGLSPSTVSRIRRWSVTSVTPCV
jgi:hypothetical protein